MSSTTVRAFVALLVGPLALACSPAAPLELDSRVLVERLASDELEGRLTGSDGSRLAADYIIEQLTSFGAEPLPGLTGYHQSFGYTSGVSDVGTTLDLERTDAKAMVWPESDALSLRALAFSDSGSVEGPLVFAGYGLSVPESDGFSYDSYATLDVTDKIVVVLRYFPEDTEGELRAHSRATRVFGTRRSRRASAARKG